MQKKKKLTIKEKLDLESYEQIILLGDFNGVVNTSIDNFPERKGGKLPTIFFEMVKQEQLEDIWSIMNENGKEYTFYSDSNLPPE